MIIKYFRVCIAICAVALTIACHDSKSTEDHHGSEEKEENKSDKHDEADEIHFTQAQAKACQLKVESVKPSDFAEVVEVSGRVLPAQGAETTVTAIMAGIVSFSNKTMTEGAPVNVGTPLFIINAQPMANGNPAAVAQSEAKAAKQAFLRAQKLAAEQIISQRELEDARQRYEAATATAQSMGNAAQSRGANAPISGFIKTILVKPGDYVSAGQALATITQSRRVQLRANLPERYYSLLSRISTANFRMSYDKSNHVYSIAELSGRLVSKGKVSSTDDFFVPIIFEFNNTGDIVSGSFAEVYLQGSPRQGVISVPSEAISESQGLYFVYVQEHDDSYRRVEVRLGDSNGRRTEILSGLSVGDKVVINGVTQIRLAANAGAVPEGHHH